MTAIIVISLKLIKSQQREKSMASEKMDYYGALHDQDLLGTTEE